MKDKIIFGINFSHDTAVAAVVNGEVKVAIEEERLNRVKHCDGKTQFGKIIPYLGINYCCEYLGIEPKDVDLWVVNACFNDAVMAVKQQLIGIPDEKIVDVELPGHHMAHAYSAFYPSPFEEAAVLVYDVNGGFLPGKKENYSIYHGTSEGIKPLVQDFLSYGELSTAELYVIYAAILQLSPKEKGDYGRDDSLSSGGKLMGYAAYANPKLDVEDPKLRKALAKVKKKYTHRIPPIIEEDGDHIYISNKKLVEYLKTKGLVYAESQVPNYNSIFGYNIQKFVEWKYRKEKEDLKGSKFIQFGGEGQAILEDSILRMAHKAYEKTKSKNICVAGGTMLNMVACTKILEETPFENIFVQPASNDGGNAVGCALYGYYKHFGLNSRPYLNNSYKTYLGIPYPEEQIEKILKQNWAVPFNYKKIESEEEQIETLVSLLLKEHVIALFKGRSEFGPRALGNRSFLASPLKASMLEKMNKVKHRAWYRPVAPVILEEEFKNYFEAPYEKAPFMTLNSYCKDITLEKAPAVCHIDGSARAQTVSEEYNPFFYKLLKRFHEKSGVPILINTSFNIQEPIVENPENAINTFLFSWQDVHSLLLENYLIDTVGVYDETEQFD